MSCLEDSIASDMISLLAYILSHTFEKITVRHAEALQQAGEVVGRVSSIRASVVLATRRQGFCE